MTSKQLNALIQQGYQAAQAHEEELTAAYVIAYRSAAKRVSTRFRAAVTVASFTDWSPPNGGVFDDDAAKADAAAAADPLLEQMLTAAASPVLQGGESTFDIGSEAAQALLESMSGITDQVAEGVKDPALRAIGQAWNAGLSQGDAAQAIQDAIGSIAETEAQMLARTSLNAISGGASHIAVQQLNDKSAANGESVFGRKRWLTAHDNRVRPTHAEAEGQTVDIRQPFIVGGAQLQFPADPNGPIDITANCRCVVIYEEVPTSTLPFTQEVTPMKINPYPGSTTNTLPTSYSFDVTGTPSVTVVVNGEAPPAERPDLTCPSCGTTVQGGTEICPECGASMITNGATPAEAYGAIAWQGTLAVEGKPTDDGRYLVPGGITERDLPLTLMAMIANVGEGHDGAQAAGRIEQIWREPAPDLGPFAVRVMGAGFFDTGEFGMEIARMVDEDTLNGISVDLAIQAVALLDPDTFMPVDENAVDIVDILSGAYLFGITEASIIAATICPMPAFADANDISLVASGEPRVLRMFTKQQQDPFLVKLIQHMMTPIADGPASADVTNLVASAAPVAPLRPSRDWFCDPQFKKLTPVEFNDDGYVSGHLAGWESCHTGVLDRCATPFTSRSNYAFFHTGTIETEEGEFIPVGRISLDTNHAHLELDAARARSHYDHTGTVGAFVRAGEDRFGIWIAGAVRHDLPEAALRDMRANPPSGDWRRRELIGVLCVPFPGYPVPHLAMVASGDTEEVVTLITGLDTRMTDAEFEASIEALSDLAGV